MGSALLESARLTKSLSVRSLSPCIRLVDEQL